MRKKDIKVILEETVQSKIPDITDRINLSQIVIEPKKNARFHFSFVNSWRLATVVVLALLITVGVLSANKNISPITPITLSAETTSSFTAVSSSVLLNAKNTQSSLSNGQIRLSSNMHNNKTVMNDKVSLLNPYFNMIELFLVEDELSFSSPVASNLPGYTLMIIYQMNDLTGVSQTYSYYFTETVDGGTVMITGLINILNVTYYLEGVKETSDDETEILVKTYTNPAERDKHYVETKSIKKQDEQSFVYRVFVDGEETEISELKLEKQGKKTKIKLKYENDLSDEEIVIEATRAIVSGKAVLKVTYEIENSLIDESGEMTVYVAYNEDTNKNQYVYQIKNAKGNKNECFGSRKNTEDDDESEDDD